MILKEWLKERLEPKDVRRHSEQELTRSGFSEEIIQKLMAKGPSPLWMESWKIFLGKMLEDDELWYFETPPETWNNFCGAAGYALIRSGQIIETIATKRS